MLRKDHDLVLNIFRLRCGSEGRIFITIGYQNGRDEILECLVEGLNCDLSPRIDVGSIGDQQGRTRRQKGIEIRHYASLPVETAAIDWSTGEADHLAPVVNRFRQNEGVVGPQRTKI